MDSLSNQPPLRDRLDLDYEELRAEITHALASVPHLDIGSDADIMAARDVALSLKALAGKVDAAFKAEKAPYLEGGRTVDLYFKGLRAVLDATISTITTQASAWQAKKLALAREQAASEARVAAMLEEPPPEPPKPAVATRVSDGGGVVVSGAVRWDYEITDADALPRELLQPNVAAIRARIAGLKATTTIDKAAGAIPGLKIVERISTTFR
jgi:hypothetical protein